MSLPTDNRLHKVRIQLNLKIPDSCSLSASQCLHSSMRQKFNTNFKGVPLFQAYTQGLGTQLWTLDAKMDNGVVLTCGGLLDKIRTTIQLALEEVLSFCSASLSCSIAASRHAASHRRPWPW